MSYEYYLPTEALPPITGAENLSQVPFARAAYSANPGFIEGADDPNRITSARSVFQDEELVEGLEALVRQTAKSCDIVAKEVAPLNRDMALKGLSKILKVNDLDRDFWRKAKSVRSNLSSAEERAAIMQQQAAEQAEREAEQAASLRAAEAVEAAKREKREAEQAEQAEFHRIFRSSTREAISERPDLDPASLFAMTQDMYVSEGGLNLLATDTRMITAKLNNRLGQYLDDPNAFKNDLEILFLTRSNALNQDYPEWIGRFSMAISYGVCKALRGCEYDKPEDFTQDVVDKWLEIEINAVRQPYADEANMPVIMSSDGEQDPIFERDMSLDMLISRCAHDVFAASLNRIARTKPTKLVDTLYKIASGGIGNIDLDRCRATATFLLPHINHDPMVGVQLYLGTISTNDKIRAKALDVHEALKLAGRSVGITADIKDYARLFERIRSKQDLRILAETVAKNLPYLTDAIRGSIEIDERAAANSTAFRDYAATPEGSHTLYAQVAHAIQLHERISLQR